MTLDDELPILYPVEAAIASHWRHDPSLLDLHVLDAVTALARKYSLEDEGRSFRMPPMDARAERLANDLAILCESLLGRSEARVAADGPGSRASLAEVTASLKRLKKSILLWTEEGGRQGYLTYINKFLPSA